MKKFDKALLLILGVGLLMRVVGLNQSLWHDEAIGALEVKNSGFVEIATDFAKVDNHPPFYYLTLKAWSNVFGYSEIALRSLSIVFGLGTIWVVYYIIKKTFGSKGKIAALLLATSGLHIYYSQEARMYAMSAFLASLATYYFLKLKTSNIKPWVLFSLSLLLLLFTDYVNVFLLPVFWVWASVAKKSIDWWKKFILTHIPSIMVGALWLPIFVAQIKRGSLLLQNLPQWTSVAGGASFKHVALVWIKFIMGRISFFDKLTYYSLVALFSVPFLFLLLKSIKTWKKHSFYWYWLILPLGVGFLASFYFPALIYFRFLYVLPAFYILIELGLYTLGSKTRNLLIVVLVFINLFGWIVFLADKGQQREQWRQAVEYMEKKAEKTQDAVIFAFIQPPAGYRWYSGGKVEVFGVTDRKLVNDLVADKRGVYYFDYLADLTDPNREIMAEIEILGFSRQDSFAFSGVGEVTYWAKDR